MTASPIIVALDFADPQHALSLAAQLNPDQCRVKVGKELFTRAGPSIIRALHDQGFEVFLDLKFHDIPTTVAKACLAAAELGVWMMNVHASGGLAMMRAARAALDDLPNRPLLIAVTVLTSMDAEDFQALGYQHSIGAQVLALAALAQKADLDGVVCSAQEASALRGQFGDDFILVTPGIRPASAARDDQQRVMTPRAAREAGSHYLVVGRPITQASDPQYALSQLLAELATT